MLLKQLKQLALTAIRRNADYPSLARFYGSPAVCESLATSKSSKRLSRDERRAVVVSFVNEYREANDGRFPTLRTILKEVGGGQYYVRDILQELKHKPNAPFPIAAKVTASVPNDTSSQSLNHPPSYSSASNTKSFSPVVVDPVFQAHCPDTVDAGSDQKQATKDIYHPLPDESNLEGSNIFIPATPYERESAEFLKNSDSEEEEKLTRLGSQESIADNLEGAAVSAKFLPSETRQVSEKEAGEVKTREKSSAFQADNPDIVETGNGQNQATIEFSHPNSDESPFEGNNSVITATHEKTETETSPYNGADSNCDCNTRLPEILTSVVSEEKLTCLGSQESKPDHPASENVLPTETRREPEKCAGEVKTVEKSSTWSNIVSFAKGFASFWRKG